MKLTSDTNTFFSSSTSIIFHLIILFAVLFIINEISDRPRVNPRYILVAPNDPLNELPAQENTVKENANANIAKPAKEKSEKLLSSKHVAEDMNHSQTFYNFTTMRADTTKLDQLYHENTLDVTLKYPNGWTYIDQDLKHKLDGVTFWFQQTKITPPPYVHLEVVDKDMFDPSRFKNKTEINGNQIYFNDPEELEGQISQTIYIRTHSNEDYSLKLIIDGKNYFNSFQPIFWGMVKSFKFGRSLF